MLHTKNTPFTNIFLMCTHSPNASCILRKVIVESLCCQMQTQFLFVVYDNICVRGAAARYYFY